MSVEIEYLSETEEKELQGWYNIRTAREEYMKLYDKSPYSHDFVSYMYKRIQELEMKKWNT